MVLNGLRIVPHKLAREVRTEYHVVRCSPGRERKRKNWRLMPVFVRKESGLLLPEHKGTIITLYDALGRALATIPMHGTLDPTGLSGHAPVMHTGVFDRATVDMPGWPRCELNGLTLNTSSLTAGMVMNMNINLGVAG